MNNLKAKCPLPQMYTQESSEISKIDQVKENVPPNIMNIFLLQNELSSFVKATPKKSKKHVEEPLTPNTNIKLLTSLAAERDYANCTTPKSRKQPLETSPVDNNPVLDENVAVVRTARKEKSLAIICTRFLHMYPLYPTAEQKCIISLDEACMKLGIERRRLYDIVNVFESINMLNKLSKNKYIWFGKNKLVHSLQSIKIAAQNENMLEKLQYVLDLERTRPDYKQSCILNEVSDFSKQLGKKNASFSSETLEHGNFPEIRKEKSLAFMSQRFLMLFLVSPFKIISLGVAAKVLNGFQKNDGGAQMKTQIRRLYDIANVLSSIGLIRKEVTFNQSGRKPAFKYIGPGVQDSSKVENPTQISTPKKRKEKSKGLTRHSSFQEICAVAEMEHRKLFFDESPSSAPPFDSNLISKNESRAISFSNLDFNTSLGGTKEQIKAECTETEDEVQKISLPNVTLNKLPDNINGTKVCEQSALMPLQPNMTMINVPKGIFTGNNPCYILSPVAYQTSQVGTFLLFTPPVPSYNPIMEDKTSINEPKEVPGQKNTIFRPPDLEHNLSQKLLIFNEKPNQASCEQIKPPSNDILANNMESNESSVCSTRNNSPTSSTSRYDSPFSIPSGYATPVPNVSSDISFPSCVETSTILKNIENCVDSTSIIKSENMSQNSTSLERSDVGYLTNNHAERNITVLKDLAPNIQEKDRKSKVPSGSNGNGSLKEIQNFSYLTNSCSNDSLNSEVFEILKGKKLGDSTKKHLSIDENTVLSPIKRIKKNTFSPNLVPSPFITPPHVPEKVFVFNTASYQSTSIKPISTPRPLKIKNTTNNFFPS